MFDEFARDLIGQLPKLPNLDPVECRRALSRAYLMIVNGRLRASGARDGDPGDAVLRDTLRRMANALESVAVFDPLSGLEQAEKTREASAFVAGEALSLLHELIAGSEREAASGDPLTNSATYALVESALLYIIGGYDVNAVAVVSRIRGVTRAQGTSWLAARQRGGSRLLERIVALCRSDVSPFLVDDRPTFSVQPQLLDDLANEVRARLYEELSRALDTYLEWLAGDVDNAMFQLSLSRVIAVRDSCRIAPDPNRGVRATAFADVYHLAGLIAAALAANRNRSVVHSVPPPGDGDENIRSRFPAYLRSRAKGTSSLRGRPLLWPSTLEFVRECLPGPHRDAVISMPTGSGKSFLAELAVAHALTRGWVLYLTPTNALAHQVRRDLSLALRPFDGVTVSAFVGGAEYTTLSDEQLLQNAFVGVMTPEKCALALRLYPETFARCALCVFDECHLLNDRNRGAVADVLLAQLFGAAPQMRTLLMSAMVSNADELAAWLTDVRGTEAVPSKIKWRPSRAARGFVFVDQLSYEAADVDAKEKLALLAEGKAKTISTELPLGWLAALSGPWTSDGADDYRAAVLPIGVTYEVKRSKKGQLSSEISSWKNTTGVVVSELLASHGLAAINFVLSSRHHAFGNANRVTAALPGALGDKPLPRVVDAQLAIADVELGVETCLRQLLRRGVAVHTSAMLQVEQAASESMFSSGLAKLMVATGTLAQGLNLPATVVVVSGSKLATYGEQLSEVDAAAGLSRANELILNGFGRAGRPGFANQGVVILVSDDPFTGPTVGEVDGQPILAKYPVLGEPDASVVVRSPIETFLDDLLAMGAVGDATKLEVVTLTPLLSSFDSDEENAGTILRRTFAGYRRRWIFTAESADLARERIAQLKTRFLEREGVPNWMPLAAMKAGVEFFRAQRMWEACKERGLGEVDALSSIDVRGWFDVLIDVLARMPIWRVREYLDSKKTPTPRTRLATLASDAGANEPSYGEHDRIPWIRPEGWEATWRELGDVVLLYMNGRPLVEVGAALFGTKVETFGSQRSDGSRGLPPVFKFIGEIVDRALSVDAGCFLALHESWLAAEHPGVAVPESLQALPLCIRNGCNNLDTLAWFRSGFRQRVCAHALAERFPLIGAVGDAGRAESVRSARRMWLDEVPGVEVSLLDYARVVVSDGTSERN